MIQNITKNKNIIKKVNIDRSEMKQEFEALGTVNQIIVYDNQDKELLEQAVNRVMEIDDKMSVYKPGSEISNLNRHSGKNPVVMSDETLELLVLAKKISDASKGAFDITIGPVVRLWGIGKKNNYIPEEDAIKEYLKFVNYVDIDINIKNKTAYLRKANQAVDLGGIAKGYAADEVKRILTQGGVKSAMINLGGNIVTIGQKVDKSPWKIGIQNPLAPRGEYVGNISIVGKTVVTSGSNERFFMKDGIRYHHLLDPRSGKPAWSGLLSVTVVCENSSMADALTTALFVLGLEEGIELLKNFEADAIFLTENGEIYITEGLKNNFKIKGN